MSSVLDENINNLIDDLSKEIIEMSEVPLNSWAVAALLESRGLRDVDAIEKYGKKNIFDLAQVVFDKSIAYVHNTKIVEDKAIHKDTLVVAIKKFFHFYFKGMIFAGPMAGQIASIIYFRYSLWAWVDFTVPHASLVAMATILSFIATGGLVQAIGREGTFYVGQKNPLLLEKICKRLISIGLKISFGLSLLILVFNFIFPYFTIDELFVFMIYYNLLTALWLILAILFMMGDNFSILISTLFGTMFVHLGMEYWEWTITMSHSIGICSASAFAGLWFYIRMKLFKKNMDDKCKLAKIPRPAILFYIIEPFFIFGILYFSLLFTDRVIGWSASDYELPLIIWFRSAYELGMDWALITLIFGAAALTYTVNQFNLRIIPVQQTVKAKSFKIHNDYFLNFYKKQVLILFVVCFLSIFLVYVGGLYLRDNVKIQEVADFFSSPITYFTYWLSAIGYALLVFAQLNALFFFSLGKPKIVIKCISIGLIANTITGYFLSRFISYEYSVVGLLVGCLVYSILIFKEAKYMFKTLDYQYYSAF